MMKCQFTIGSTTELRISSRVGTRYPLKIKKLIPFHVLFYHSFNDQQ